MANTRKPRLVVTVELERPSPTNTFSWETIDKARLEEPWPAADGGAGLIEFMVQRGKMLKAAVDNENAARIAVLESELAQLRA